MSYVGKNCFFPAPKVDSAILKIEVFPNPKVSDEKLFFRLIKGAFSQRRKTLSNSLRTIIHLEKESIEKSFSKQNTDSFFQLSFLFCSPASW